MRNKPILILQMQRMGDLVLTFPLLLWLQRTSPDTPIWVVAEKTFFEGLMPIAPSVTFFPPSAAPVLKKEKYSAVINLSHRPEAAALAGSVSTERIIGPYTTVEGTNFIGGDWQLYRASLVHNNRHNLFHWAELNALDIIPHSLIAATQWEAPDTKSRDTSRIGLFLGASEKGKRPEPEFWATLAKELMARGHKPVLLGGPPDKPLGRRTAALAKIPALNLTGHFSLLEFTRLIASLRLMVTPDTGPMHVAAWASTPTLNLSMGPVHPWETGPYQPGHYVLRSTISCTGCWHCKHPSVLCKERFSPKRTAALIHSLITRESSAKAIHLPSQELLISHKGKSGLYQLAPTSGAYHNNQRHQIARFWRSVFYTQLSPQSAPKTPEFSVADSAHALANQHTDLARIMEQHLIRMGKELSFAIRRQSGPTMQLEYWKSYPPLMRPLSGYVHMLLHNGAFSTSAYLQAVQLIESIVDHLPR